MKKLYGLFLSFMIFQCCNNPHTTKEKSLTDLGEETEVKKETTKPVLERYDIEKKGTYYGIDISHFQGDLVSRLDKKDSLHFIICKSTEGTTYVDPDFQTNWSEVKKKGFIRGAYHFYLFSDDPIKQANHFIKNISDIDSLDIAPAVDVEEGSLAKPIDVKKMQKDLKAFLDQVEKKLNRKPIIYSDPSFANEYLDDASFAKYKLWLADYTKEKPIIPTAWESDGYLIWQKSESYSIASEAVDLDVFNGKLNDLVN